MVKGGLRPAKHAMKTILKPTLLAVLYKSKILYYNLAIMISVN